MNETSKPCAVVHHVTDVEQVYYSPFASFNSACQWGDETFLCGQWDVLEASKIPEGATVIEPTSIRRVRRTGEDAQHTPARIKELDNC